MSGFLDRLAARAVGDAPLVHPRVRTRFEPDAGALPAAPAGEIAQVKEVAAAVPRTMEAREPVAEARTFEPEVRSVPAERRTDPPAVAEPAEAPPSVDHVPSEAQLFAVVRPVVAPPLTVMERPVAAREEDSEEAEAAGSRLRRDPHPIAPSPTRTHTRAGEGEPEKKAVASSPPLPGEGSADGRGGRGVRVHRAAPPEELPAEPLRAEERLLAEPPPVRPRSALAAELPTVEADRRGAPLPPSLEESEPSETVVHVSIGRIDVRANQPAAPERRPSRPAGPRLSLGDYLKRREERRR